MQWKFFISLFLFVLILPVTADAALIDRVNEAYRAVHGKNPTPEENSYWAKRVSRGDKKTFEALVGGIAFRAANGRGSGAAAAAPTATATAPVGSFKTTRSLYPNPQGANLLPEGTLISADGGANVYYVRGNKKSWVLPSILNRWLGEAHFFNRGNTIVGVSGADLARYASASSVNPLYIGKVLKHPNGQQFYIDDKYRKRPLSASVRKALKFPDGNIYGTTAAHLNQFKTGPALKGDKQPGGMIIYDGAYHGGRIWRLEEAAGGVIQKRLYLTDYFYEAEYYPDENQRVGVSAAELAKYQRGPNISHYPSGWVTGIGNNIYVVANNKLRRITSPSIFAAMGYKKNMVLKVHQSYLLKYAHSHNISAFKSIVDSKGAITGGPKSAPSAASTAHLTKVKESARSLIQKINPLWRQAYDREITPAINRQWADYIFAGEVDNQADLLAAMKRARATGKFPSRTCRTCAIDDQKLIKHWLPYLFQQVHRRSPNSTETAYWTQRVEQGRNTIQKLDSNIQWLWQNERKTHK